MPANPKTITIREDFRAFLRPLTKEEKALLHQSLDAEGCRDPLVVWKHGRERILVDGHHRYAHCTANKIPFEVAERTFADDEEALRWMERNGRGRRNETRTGRRYYLGARYLREKQDHGTNQHTNRIPHSEGSSETAERIAAEEGVSRATVERAARFTGQVDELDAHLGPERLTKWAVLAEQVGFSPKLCAALLEASPDDAYAAILAAKNAAKDSEKPVTASAVLKRLVGQGQGRAAGGTGFDYDDHMADIRSRINRVIREAEPDDLQTLILTLRAWLANAESSLEKRKQ